MPRHGCVCRRLVPPFGRCPSRVASRFVLGGALAWIALDPFCTRICRVCLGDAHQAECSRRHVSCCVLRCFDGHLAITRPIVSPLSPFIFGLLTLYFRGLRVLLVLCAGFQRKMSTFRHNFPFDRLTEFGVKMRLIRVLSADVVLDSSRRGLLTT